MHGSRCPYIHHPIHNFYFGHGLSAAELCDEARRLPGANNSRDKLRSATDALALKNEELKRKLGDKKDNLTNAIKAQVIEI